MGTMRLNDVLKRAAQLTHEERRARIRVCVAAEGHVPHRLPLCRDAETDRLLRYCDLCWSVIDRHGLTWSWAPR